MLCGVVVLLTMDLVLFLLNQKTLVHLNDRIH